MSSPDVMRRIVHPQTSLAPGPLAAARVSPRGQPKNVIRQMYDDLLWAIEEAESMRGAISGNPEMLAEFDLNLGRARRALRTVFPTVRIRR